MYIHSLSRLLSFPLIIMAFGIIWYSASVDNKYSWLIFIPVTLLVVLYVFHGPLDYWWHKKFPPRLEPEIIKWLTRHFPWYNTLSGGEKTKFEHRLALYTSARLFQSVGKEKNDNVPEDIKCMVAAHAVQMTLGLEDFLIGDLDRVFLYKHPFPTPDMPWLHNVEVNMEDGVLILSMEQLINAIVRPDIFYNIASHAYAEALIHLYPELRNTDISDPWTGLKALYNWDKDYVLKSTGYKETADHVVHLHAFFKDQEKYRTKYPEQFLHFKEILNTPG